MKYNDHFDSSPTIIRAISGDLTEHGNSEWSINPETNFVKTSENRTPKLLLKNFTYWIRLVTSTHLVQYYLKIVGLRKCDSMVNIYEIYQCVVVWVYKWKTLRLCRKLSRIYLQRSEIKYLNFSEKIYLETENR